MKFLHLGDLHLGKSLFEFELKEDQKYILDQIIQVLVEKDIHHIVLAGDVYDKSIPAEWAVKLFDAFLNNLKENNIQAYIISGNHDSDERLNFGSSLFASNGIHIVSKFDGELKKVTVEDEYGSVDVYLLPFVKASQVKHFYPDAKIESYHDAVKTVIEKANIDTAKRNVLVSHQFVAGKSDPTLSGSESLGVQNVGTIEKIGVDCFDDFDYVALGHIHSSQQVGREEVRYSGSLLKYSLSEANSVKRFPIVELKEKGKVDIELLEIKPKRDLRHIKGKMKDLLDPGNIQDVDDFIYVTLTDEDMVNDVMATFQQFYPNTVKIDYENRHTKELDSISFDQVMENKSFSQLIQDFYLQMYGSEISDEEMEIMKNIAKEVGVEE